MTEPSARKRGRPRGTGRVQPESIVDAALDSLADGGYQALTMRGIGRTLGVSLATIQHHFPTKEVLWRAAIDHVTVNAIERRSHIDPNDLAGKIALFFEPGSGRLGLLPSLLSDRSPGSSQRLAYMTEQFTEALADPGERMAALEAEGVTRHIDERALFALITIGIGSIAGAPDAMKSIYGFDLDSVQGRTDLAEGLADIIGLGLLRR